MSIETGRKAESFVGYCVWIESKNGGFFAHSENGKWFSFKRSAACKYRDELKKQLKSRCRVIKVELTIAELP